MIKNLYYAVYDAPFGEISMIWDKDEIIYRLDFSASYNSNYFDNAFGRGNYLVDKAELPINFKIAFDEYFSGKINAFDNIKTQIYGTDFQIKAWEALKTIPYGKVLSYQQQAEVAGNNKAVRAIGGANNKNPIAIIIPCHRVIGKNGKMVGFGGGIETKEWLLAHEGFLKPMEYKQEDLKI